MIIGVKKIKGRMTQGDEYGLYRQTEDGHDYLLFVVTTYNDIVKHGRALAEYFGVKFENYVSEPDEPEEEGTIKDPYLAGIMGEPVIDPEDIDEIETSTKGKMDWPLKDRLPAKPKRVSGVAKKVQPLIGEGKTDEEIFQVMLPEYIAAGRSEKVARELLLPYLKDIREGKI